MHDNDTKISKAGKPVVRIELEVPVAVYLRLILNGIEVIFDEHEHEREDGAA